MPRPLAWRTATIWALKWAWLQRKSLWISRSTETRRPLRDGSAQGASNAQSKAWPKQNRHPLLRTASAYLLGPWPWPRVVSVLVSVVADGPRIGAQVSHVFEGSAACPEARSQAQPSHRTHVRETRPHGVRANCSAPVGLLVWGGGTVFTIRLLICTMDYRGVHHPVVNLCDGLAAFGCEEPFGAGKHRSPGFPPLRFTPRPRPYRGRPLLPTFLHRQQNSGFTRSPPHLPSYLAGVRR